jgi:hypothetical protein
LTKLVRVRWNDAHAGGHEQYDVASVPHAPLVIETFGWLLRDDDAGVSVASEYLPETSNYRSYTFIPRGMVVEVKDIAPVRRAARKAKPIALEG